MAHYVIFFINLATYKNTYSSALITRPLIIFFLLKAMIQKYLSKKGGRFYCICVEFRKLSDKIDHSKLFNLLQKIRLYCICYVYLNLYILIKNVSKRQMIN